MMRSLGMGTLLIVGISLWIGLSTVLGADPQVERPVPPDRKALNDSIQILEKAIRLGDYAAFDSDWPPPDRNVRWAQCGQPEEVLTFEAAVDRLRKKAKGQVIQVDETLWGPLFITSVETTGWLGGPSFLYLDFIGVGYWKWYSVTECERKLYHASEAAGFEAATSEEILKPVSRAFQTGSFDGFDAFVVTSKHYHWSACGPNDASPLELSFQRFSEMLRKASKDREIHVYAEPSISETGPWPIVDTEGWRALPGFTEPFLGFRFRFSDVDRRWHLTGVCDSPSRPSIELSAG